MGEQYLPPSDFLQAVIAETVPFGANDLGEINLKRLITMTSDSHDANRDWATLLLSQLELDRADVRDALIAATADTASSVRAEAILGLAQIDAALALPFLQAELTGEAIQMPLLEAAVIVADPSLLYELEAFASPSDDAFLDSLVLEAIEACQPRD